MGYFVAAGIAFAVILRTIHGAFHAASSNSASTWVADIIPRSRMGEGLGMYGLSMAISTAVAPALGIDSGIYHAVLFYGHFRCH
jgi:MFS family permease